MFLTSLIPAPPFCIGVIFVLAFARKKLAEYREKLIN